MNVQTIPDVHVHSAGFKHKNLNLQWLRGAAAILVLVYHASTYLAFERQDERFRAVFGDAFGLIGVAVFFAISGALMADIVRKTDPFEFLIHRILRIYPIFILVSVAVPILFSGDLAFDGRAILLAPIGGSGNFRLGVEWTLILEMLFYILLFLLALAGMARHVERFAIGWIVVLLVALLFSDAPFQGDVIRPDLLTAPFLAVNFAFAGGLLIPGLARRGAFQPSLAVPGAAAAMACMAFAPGYDRLAGAVAAVIFVGLALAPQPIRVGDSRLERTATRLGDSSYALYLCHVPIQLAIYTRLDVSPALAWTLAVIVPIAVALVLGRFDIGLYRRLRGWSDKSSPASTRRWALVFAGAYLVMGAYFQLFESD